MQGHSKDMKQKGRRLNVVWSQEMDKCLIESLVIQAKHGNKVDKSFNEFAYNAACMYVNTCFDLNMDRQKVINRLKTIKKRYKTLEDMLNQDGFMWNPHTKMIECDNDDLRKRYTLAHPDAKGLIGKSIEMFEELKIICGNNQTPIRRAKTAGRSQIVEIKNNEYSGSSSTPSSEDLSETEDTNSFTGKPEYSQIPNFSQEPPLKQHSKRRRVLDSLQDAMWTVASSLQALTDSFEQNKSSIDSHELLQAVMELDDLEEGKQMYAFEYLNADPVKARAFMAYDVRMRKVFLFRQFWWWK